MQWNKKLHEPLSEAVIKYRCVEDGERWRVATHGGPVPVGVGLPTRERSPTWGARGAAWLMDALVVLLASLNQGMGGIS